MRKTIVKIFMPFFIIMHGIAMERRPIIVLNGSSCAGKSSIAQQLREKLGTRSVVVSYDDFRRIFFTQHYKSLQLLPDDYKYTEVTVFFDDVKKRLSTVMEQEKKEKEIAVSDFYKKANGAFYNHIQVLSQAQVVIVDTIIVSEQQKMMITQQLGNTMKTVFVHVPFSAIVDRIKKRNAVGVGESRYANRVLSMYPQFYAVNAEGNMRISMQEIESTVELTEFLPCSAEFPTGNLLIEKIIESFGMQSNQQRETIKLMPRMSHDFIIDTGVATPEQCALFLFNSFKQDSFTDR